MKHPVTYTEYLNESLRKFSNTQLSKVKRHMERSSVCQGPGLRAQPKQPRQRVLASIAATVRFLSLFFIKYVLRLQI